MSVAYCLWQPSTRAKTWSVVIVILVATLCLYRPIGVLVGAVANVLALAGVLTGDRAICQARAFRAGLSARIAVLRTRIILCGARAGRQCLRQGKTQFMRQVRRGL